MPNYNKGFCTWQAEKLSSEAVPFNGKGLRIPYIYTAVQNRSCFIKLYYFSQKYKQETYPSSLIRQLELGAKLKQKQKITSVSVSLLQSILWETNIHTNSVIFTYHVTIPWVKCCGNENWIFL